MRILVVEPDPDLRAALVGALEADGHTVSSAPTAVAALAVAPAGPWDVCLADVFGVDPAAPTSIHRTWLRELGARAPVVAAAVHSWIATVSPAELGAAALLRKPVSLEDVRAALSRVVPGDASSASP